MTKFNHISQNIWEHRDSFSTHVVSDGNKDYEYQVFIDVSMELFFNLLMNRQVMDYAVYVESEGISDQDFQGILSSEMSNDDIIALWKDISYSMMHGNYILDVRTWIPEYRGSMLDTCDHEIMWHWLQSRKVVAV